MLKSNWIVWLFVLCLTITVTSASQDCKSTSSKKKHTKAIKTTLHTTKIILKTTKTTKTITKSTKLIVNPTATSKSVSCHTCHENHCDHHCSDKICKHQCKDGPCNRKCIDRPPRYEPQLVAVAVLLMTIGVFFMAMGFPFFIVTMALTGLLIGSIVTWICLGLAEPTMGYTPRSTIYLSASIGVGLLFAIASLFCWKVTIYLLCASAGYMLSIYVWTWRKDFIFHDILARNMIGLSLSFLFILGLVLLEFATIIVSTSFIGAYIFILGLDLFLKTGFMIGFQKIFDFREKEYVYETSTQVIGMLLAVLGLSLVSTLWQRYFNRGKRFGLRVVINSNDTLKSRFKETQKKFKK